MKLKPIAFGAAIALASTASFATNDGLLSDTSSTGDLDITVTIPDLVQITNLGDIALGTFSGAAMSGEDQVCVYRNGSGAYQITFTAGSNNGAVDAASGTTAYTLQSAAGDTVAYTVDYEDTVAGAYADTDIAINTALTGQSGNGTDATCAGGDNAKVQVNVAAADLQAVPAGDYVGTLYLTVAPE